ncbi:MAG: helix-turn-helix domain-containing protein [Proteobacteria bacterium]|nr:helix-turn-helix domain-containing protein [Pseudomonadota bacterium]
MKQYDETEAGEYLGGEDHPIPRATMQYWRTAGKGPVYSKLGRLVRYSQAALDAFIAKNTRQSTCEILEETRNAA